MSARPDAVLAGRFPAVEVAPHTAPLVRDYLAGADALAPFFAGHPADPAAYRRKAAEIDGRLEAAARQRLAPAFRPLSETAASRLARVLAGEGYFVTTGQQTGLFTGPLYTIYKALSAIRLAAALEPIVERPVLALFWCASDDHDWDEVNHVWLHDARGQLERIGLADDPAAPAVAMSHRRLPPGIGAALDAFRAVLPEGPERHTLLEPLVQAYAEGRTMGAAFGDALAAVLRGFPIALVDSAHPLVKLHSRATIGRALAEREADEAAVAAQTAALAAAGYPPQVALAEGASNVFFQDEQGRDRLLRERGEWRLRRSRRRFTDGELAALLERDPAAFSPNVLLRPVVESALFPTLAYVGGPAETSYFAQLGCLFRAHGIMPPVAVPRHSVTLVEERTRKTLAAFSLGVAEARTPFEALVARVLKEEMPAAVTGALAALRADIARSFEGLAEAAAEVDATLRAPLHGARNQALLRTADLEKKITRQLRHRNAERLERLRRAAAQLYPLDAPQERVLNVFPFLARYGPELLQEILAALPVAIDRNVPGYAGVRCDPARLPPRRGAE